jgi:hypothetical protein
LGSILLDVAASLFSPVMACAREIEEVRRGGLQPALMGTRGSACVQRHHVAEYATMPAEFGEEVDELTDRPVPHVSGI